MAAERPRLSVITPVLNGIMFIEDCIRNVIEQGCDDVEHVIIDGASDDGTREVIEQYAARYPHIRCISEKDKNQSDAMNKGVALASGGIIGFLNYDDFYEPNVLKRALGLFNGLPEPSFIAANCNVRHGDGTLSYVCRPRKTGLTDLLLGYEINPHPINPSAYFYHASLHAAIGLYDLDLNYNMDRDFIFRAVRKVHIRYIDEVWGNFRDMEGTNTYEDAASGRVIRRDRLLRKRYRDILPLGAQLEVAARSLFHWMSRALGGALGQYAGRR